MPSQPCVCGWQQIARSSKWVTLTCDAAWVEYDEERFLGWPWNVHKIKFCPFLMYKVPWAEYTFLFCMYCSISTMSNALGRKLCLKFPIPFQLWPKSIMNILRVATWLQTDSFFFTACNDPTTCLKPDIHCMRKSHVAIKVSACFHTCWSVCWV